MTPSLIGGLDTASRRTLHRLAIHLGAVVTMAVVLEPHVRAPFVATMTSVLAIGAVFLALLRREAIRSSSLNRWDEAMALLGVKHLALIAL